MGGREKYIKGEGNGMEKGHNATESCLISEAVNGTEHKTQHKKKTKRAPTKKKKKKKQKNQSKKPKKKNHKKKNTKKKKKKTKKRKLVSGRIKDYPPLIREILILGLLQIQTGTGRARSEYICALMNEPNVQQRAGPRVVTQDLSPQIWSNRWRSESSKAGWSGQSGDKVLDPPACSRLMEQRRGQEPKKIVCEQNLIT